MFGQACLVRILPGVPFLSGTGEFRHRIAKLAVVSLIRSDRSASRISVIQLFGIRPQRRLGATMGVTRVAEVKVRERESIESVLRRFKREVQQQNIIKDIRKHSFT